MRKLSVFLFAMMFMVCFRFTGSAQVSVSSDGSAADPSAMFEVKSVNKGFLPPRVSLQATNLSTPVDNPATGLLIYNISTSGQAPVNVTPGYYFWNGTTWVSIALKQGTLPGEMLYWNGSQWMVVQAGLPGQFLQLSQALVPTWVGNSFATVVTSEASAITQEGAMTGGTVTGDGGATVTQRGICYSTSPGPTVSDTAIECGVGTGNFSYTLTGLTPATTYFVRAYAISSVGTAYGNEIIFTTVTPPPSCPGIPTVIYEGKTYHTVMIGAQCWLRENLNAGILVSNTIQQTNNGILEKYCYDNLESNCDIYGGLYQWAEAVQYLNGASNISSWNPPPAGSVTGICPPGWSLPTKTDWEQLAGYLGGDALAGGKMKEAGYNHWASPNTGATNMSGFSGLPGGWKHMDNYFSEITLNGSFWTATEWSAASSYLNYLRSAFENLGSTDHYKKYGYSVRCMKDTCSGYSQVSVSISASSGQVCSGETVTLTALPVNGGSNPAFQWKVNDLNVGTSSPTYTYTPANGDQVVCVLNSSLLCATGNPATSNILSLSVLTPSTVSVTINASANPVTVGTSVTLSATVINGGPSPDYQWKINGISAGSNSSIYNYIPLNGDVITCVVTSHESCVSGNPATSNSITMEVNPAAQPCAGIPTVSFGGKIYNTVQIGTQCWLKENIDIGTQIPVTQEQTNNGIIEKYCYNNQETHCAVYGGLYEWDEMMQFMTAGNRGICPEGWLIPSVDDWNTMITFLGGPESAGGKLKEPGIQYWVIPNTGATNSSGFTGMPGGYRYFGGTVHNIYYLARFWTRDEASPTASRFTRLVYNDDNIVTDEIVKTYGHSVRCLKDTCTIYNTAGISISASVNPVCAGTMVMFTAIPVNGGTNPGYIWTVNGDTVATSGAVYSYTPVNNDTVVCMMTSNAPCVNASKVTSNIVTMVVNQPVSAGVSITASVNPVPSSTPVTFTASPVNGGANPGYQWQVNSINTGTNDPIFIYNPVNNDVVTCIMTSTQSCVTGSPATSNTITMTVFEYSSCPGITTVSYGGKTYNTVLIGTQCWLRENLDIGTRINGVIDQSDNGILEKYCYNDLESNCTVYGGLYQWNEVMQYMSSPVGICPQGWHIPSDAEWYDLENFIGSEPGGKMKEAGFDHWQSPNTGATNLSGFTALPGGLIYPAKNFDELNQDCYIWSSTGNGSSAPHRTLRYTTANLERYVNSNAFGFSVRCIKDNCASLLPVSVTISVSENPVCAGTMVTFSAIPVNGGLAPSYQWKVNGSNVGIDNAQFSYVPAESDQVTCVMISSEGCVSGNPATSNTILMTVTQPLPVSVNIAVTANPVVSGTSVTFTATLVNGGPTPDYQWKVNGLNAVSGSSSYTYIPLNNDVITCVATSVLSCVTGSPAISNSITMQVLTPGSPCPGTPTITYGGQVYNTVLIGQQCWLRENLNIGMKIPPTFNQTDNGLIEKYCYDDLESDCDVYGGLYQWAELVQYLNGATNTGSWSPIPTGYVQGLCPQGWHIPSDDEWAILANNLGGEALAGGKMKETGILHWWDPNVASNSSGFTGLGSGIREPDATFIVLNQYTNFWSSTENSAIFAWSRALGHWAESLWRDGNYEKTKGFSVRCLKN